jgi:hypothetical protein
MLTYHYEVIYKRFLIFITLLKFDLMFALINILTSGKGVYNTGNLLLILIFHIFYRLILIFNFFLGWNLALDIIAGVIMLLFFFLGWKGVR